MILTLATRGGRDYPTHLVDRVDGDRAYVRCPVRFVDGAKVSTVEINPGPDVAVTKKLDCPVCRLHATVLLAELAEVEP